MNKNWIAGDIGKILAETKSFANILKRFLSFSEANFYFPKNPPEKAEIFPSEKLIISPVAFGGNIIGALRLEKAGVQSGRRILPFLPGIITLILENLSLTQNMERDQASGLLLDQAFYKKLEDLIKASYEQEKAYANLGVAIFLWPGLRKLERELSAEDFDQIRHDLGYGISRSLQANEIAGQLGWHAGKHEIGVIFAASGRIAMHGRAKSLHEIYLRLLKNHAAQFARSFNLIAGHALYPHDLNGDELALAPNQIGRILIERARITAEMLAENPYAGPQVLGFAWLPTQMGRIIDWAAPGIVRINLGYHANLSKNQRFVVIPASKPKKIANSSALIIVEKVDARESLARVVHVSDPLHPPAIGDFLILVQDADFGVEGLLEQDKFFAQFALAAKDCPEFRLVIARFSEPEITADNREIRPEFTRRLALFFQSNEFQAMRSGLCGQYGPTGAVFFFPGITEQYCADFCQKVFNLAQKAGINAAFGIFPYPMLDFHKKDSEECALKALAYAELLPAPHIGALNHLALTINADRLFSGGDEIGAIQEYQRALLLKPDDPEILNSLGVCMAALNKNRDALKFFQKAAANHPSKDLQAKIFYNLGNLYNKEKDFPEAALWFRKCVQSSPKHAYAWIRLAQTHRQKGNFKGAKAIYRHALRLAQGNPKLETTIQRRMAELENSQNNLESAKEHLHEALKRNPEDSAALLLLAKSYLANDAALAEHLARRAIKQGQDGWEILNQALKNQGKT